MRIQFSLQAGVIFIMITVSILSLLISNAVTLRRDLSIIYNRISIFSLLYSVIYGVSSLFTFEKGIGLHGGLLVITNITQIFQIFIFIICILILQLTSFYARKINTLNFSYLMYVLFYNFVYYKTKFINKMGEHFKIIEYPLILLFVICGATFLLATSDLVSIFLSIELQSYGLYLISTIYRNSELSTIGGLIYFLLGGLSSCFILLGTALLYVNSGTTNVDSFYIISSIGDTKSLEIIYKTYYISFSLLVFSIGFLFKVSAAPFHFWSPDVYDAIPTIVTTFVAIVAKIAIFVFLLELVYYTRNYFHSLNWTSSLLVSSFFSLIIGTVVGLTQFRIKRLLAYSTISHVGFILLALSIASIESIEAFMFYLVQYSISNLNTFVILITIGFSMYYYISHNKAFQELTDKNNSPIQLISQLKGYFNTNPVLSLSFIITIFSFAGIPPLIGFFAKQMVLSAALDNGFFFLAIVAILTSVIGAAYYLNIIKEIYFFSPEYKIGSWLNNFELKANIYNNKKKFIETIKFQYEDLTINNIISTNISVLTLIILLFIFINKEWLSMGTVLVQILFNT